MTLQSCLQGRYEAFLKFEKGSIKPFLEELWYLRVPAFTAVLSLIFLAGIDQTLEVYRVLALNASFSLERISFSFLLIFLLSLCIWYSGRALSLRREKESGREAFLLWLPRIFGFLPLLALGLGLFRSTNIITATGFLAFASFCAFVLVFSLLCYFIITFPPFLFLSTALGLGLSPNLCKDSAEKLVIFHWNFLDFKCESLHLFYLWLGILITVLFSNIYFIFVANRKKGIASDSKESCSTINNLFRNACTDNNLFNIRSLIVLIFLSLLVFSIFSFPLLKHKNIVRLSSILLMLFLFFFISWGLSWGLKKLDQNTGIPSRLIYFLLFCLTISLLLVAFVLPPLAPHLGSIVVIAFFLIIFLLWSSILFYLGYITRVPFITILLFLAIVSSSFNLNDNHHFREVSTSTPSIPKLEASFQDWMDYEPRKVEIKKFSDAGERYPIYIISAQGGGIFAAYHAALTLSRLQDSCPNFASHVFAISSVSGGSLGAAVFSSLVKEPLPENENTCFSMDSKRPGSLEQKAHSLLSKDLLSPLLAAGLFPDLVQRFLPFPIGAVDRARGLEYAFEQAWDINQEKPNPLEAPYYEHWEAKGIAPALVLNTTVVETGDRLVLSPFEINLPNLPNLKDIRTVACKKDIDFPLSTAAILSARFTIVTPVGWFNRCDTIDTKKQKARLADGGYFENSGVSTAVDIGSRLEEFLRAKNIKEFLPNAVIIPKWKDDPTLHNIIKVVYLAITDQPPLEIPIAGGLNELMAPMGALWNSRQARGLSVSAEAKYLLDAASADNGLKNSKRSQFKTEYADERFREFYLHDKQLPSDKSSNNRTNRFNLPLGWFLSNFSQKFIQNEIGYYKDKACPDDLKATSNNQCVLRSIKEELTLSSSSK